MQLTWEVIQANAVAFSKSWKYAKNEEAEAQGFLIDFLRVFGVDEPLSVGGFEYKLPLSGGRTGYIDYVWICQMITTTPICIESPFKKRFINPNRSFIIALTLRTINNVVIAWTIRGWARE